MTKGGYYRPGHNLQSRAPGATIRRDVPDGSRLPSWDRAAAIFGPTTDERDAFRLASERAAQDGEG